MKNSLPRFGLHADGRLHDYLTGRTVSAPSTIEDKYGRWDLAKVKALIEADQHIESAFVSHEQAQALQGAADLLDKVRKSDADFMAHPLLDGDGAEIPTLTDEATKTE